MRIDWLMESGRPAVTEVTRFPALQVGHQTLALADGLGGEQHLWEVGSDVVIRRCLIYRRHRSEIGGPGILFMLWVLEKQGSGFAVSSLAIGVSLVFPSVFILL